MTWGMFAIGWLEIGDTGKAKELFYRQLQNKREPFNVSTVCMKFFIFFLGLQHMKGL